MHNNSEFSETSPNNMDLNKNNRGLVASNSNNGNKNIKASVRPKGRRRDHPRGGHDNPPSAFQAPSDPRKFRGGQVNNNGRNRHQRPQNFPKSESTSVSGENSHLPVTLEDEFEVGSVFNHGSKKQNLNHLLNFQFEPRSGAAKLPKSSGNRKSKSGKNREIEAYKPKYNKEQYLQANCKFVVKASGDYSVHLVDPDVLVNWDLVEQVILKTTDVVPNCPICLYPPKAAKLARCGHVFCWPCILHYLALSDQTWRKCPICYESIHRHDLKSVISIPWTEFQVNDEIELCLMRRERNSLFALPVDQYFSGINDKHPNVEDKITSHSNLMIATPGQVVRGIIAKERYELETLYRDEKDEPEACFIEEALQYLSQRESGIDVIEPQYSIQETINEESSSSSEDNTVEPEYFQSFPVDLKEETEMRPQEEPEVRPQEEPEVRPRHASTSSEGTLESIEDSEEITADDLDIEISKKVSKSPKETFYFYQSSDGQPIYLHALNVQMLVHEYGSLENCPKKIRGKIMEKDNTSMSEVLRNRLRYLRHMPLTSIFEVCEIQLKPPFVSKETLNEFSGQIEARRRKRNRRAREERRREKWIQVEENKKIGKYPNLKCRIESAFHFPEVGGNVAIASARSNESIPSSVDSSDLNPGLYGSSQEMANEASFSFAKMLKQGATRPSTSSFVAPKPILNLPPQAPKNEDSEPEPEGYVPPPPKASLGDALAHAFAQATTISENQNKKPSKKNRKMKGQKISLTGSARPLMD